MLFLFGIFVGFMLTSLYFYYLHHRNSHKCTFSNWEYPGIDVKQRECWGCGKIERFVDIHTCIWKPWNKYSNTDKLYRDCQICNVREEKKYSK